VLDISILTYHSSHVELDMSLSLFLNVIGLHYLGPY